MRQHPPELLDPARSGRLEIRACQCPFCTRHGSRAAADPNGRLTISVEDRAKLQTYRFGLRTADYLVCRECGVYVAAIAGDGAEARAIVIVNALDDPRAILPRTDPCPLRRRNARTAPGQAAQRLHAGRNPGDLRVADLANAISE
ncbi:aldehyde-activating protein [Mesorhizobium sp.]|uniref:aldehyde-activating protein n=1 Tax=Mesorhizobium sp. TaxID=1871066 RepID=UPI000FE334AB|nr:aldehyde-activating protein [Mesorhizobium sp.]RWK10109.1 MAG: aldehyde-activating protein [Mesorhizobium sp.]